MALESLLFKCGKFITASINACEYSRSSRSFHSKGIESIATGLFWLNVYDKHHLSVSTKSSAFLLQPCIKLSMRSSGHDHMGSTGRSCLCFSPPYDGDGIRWAEETEDIKPSHSLLGLPELSWPLVCLTGNDGLASEELSMAEAAALPAQGLGSPEPSPPLLSPAQYPPIEVQGEAEEYCLEQVQSMVVGEVLSDVNEACKLLNIAPGTTSGFMSDYIAFGGTSNTALL